MERPIHDVLCDFARPFLELGQAAGRTPDAERALRDAALIWDLAVHNIPVEQIAEIVERAPPVIEALVRRKQLFFADDHRLAAGC